jgi:hypothetical protein
MKSRIESRTIGECVQWRMRCDESTCGRIGIWHRERGIAESTALLHDKHAHAKKAA